MNLDDFLAHVRAGAVIDAGSAEHGFLGKSAQEASRRSCSAEGEPGSAVYTMRTSPGSAVMASSS